MSQRLLYLTFLQPDVLVILDPLESLFSHFQILWQFLSLLFTITDLSSFSQAVFCFHISHYDFLPAPPILFLLHCCQYDSSSCWEMGQREKEITRQGDCARGREGVIPSSASLLSFVTLVQTWVCVVHVFA